MRPSNAQLDVIGEERDGIGRDDRAQMLACPGAIAFSE